MIMSTVFADFGNIEFFEECMEIEIGESKTIPYGNAALGGIFGRKRTHIADSQPQSRWKAIMWQHSFSDGADFALLGARLKRLTARYGVPVGEREDCVQETWLALFLEHPDWATDEPRCWAWLRRVAHNKALDVHRRARRHSLVSLDERASILGDDSSHLTDSQDTNPAPSSRPVTATIEKVLNEVTEVNRIIFIQHSQEGLEYATIGECLGLTRKQAKERYNRVLQKVRSRLGALSTHAFMGGGTGGCGP